MKSPSKKVFLALAFALTSALAAAAQERPDPRLITVTGEAEVRVVPDEVVFDVAVQTFHKDLRTAKSQTDERLKRLIELTRRYNIAERDVQTDYVKVEPRYRGNNEARALVGYSVRKDLVFKLRDVSRAEGLLSELLEADITRINSIRFQTSQPRKYRDEARALAIRAAREKAVALTAEIGQGIGRAYSIVEDPPDAGPRQSMYANITSNAISVSGDSSSDTDGTLALGQITVSARVLVRFELQ
ncbi:MAG TPA: SIMPL domain-containing protein [Pyrinomonadaceae bacterium]|nr:SIMPL domain-containing protein [Pyrinomonadaceae bacterium]